MDINQIRKSFLDEFKTINDARELERLRLKYLGRQEGELTKILRSLKDLTLEDRKKIGLVANALRQEIEKKLEDKLEEFKIKGSNLQSRLDFSLPGRKVAVGHLHPLTKMENRIKHIFLGLNFSVVEGPEAETEYYNFDALNIPPNHPARDMWDTFWLKTDTKNLLLRTHTSPMQIRYMEKHQPPFRIIVPGRVFRFEATDASHEINFHQVEGLMVAEDVNLANFKYIIQEFFDRLFGKKMEIRFRPSYFPFVEPGLEVDIKWQGRWLEVMGAGMVHPKVFEAARYNPRLVKGFAFGLGLERLAMIQYKIDDIRLFYSGDLRFINQF